MSLWFAKTLADFGINDLAALPPHSVKTPSHASIYRPVPGNAGSLLARAQSLLLENLALGQQLAVRKRRSCSRAVRRQATLPHQW
jgi:hypothetical protein